MVFILLIYYYLQYKFPSILFQHFCVVFWKDIWVMKVSAKLVGLLSVCIKMVAPKHLPLLLWFKILVSIPYFQIILSFDDMEVLIKFLWGGENFVYSFMACCLPILAVTFVLWVLLVILLYKCYSWYFDGKFLYISYWL